MKPSFLENTGASSARSIKGSISIMPLADLIQWIEASCQSGSLVATCDDSSRHFYFQSGKLIFVWSDTEGERFCMELHTRTGLALERMQEIMAEAERLEISLLGLLSCNEGFQLEQLTSIMSELAERSLVKALAWKSGQFHFCDYLPPVVLSSPVTLHTSQVLFESVIQLDEKSLQEQTNQNPLIIELMDRIERGNIEIPPMPVEMQMVMNKISTPDISIDEIVESINDPLLVSKALRICNSSFYGLRGKVGTLREAVVYMGMKAFTSIVTVHALSSFSLRNAEQVQVVLHHSMKVGMVAKQLARDIGMNHDQAFVCGLLHDLGRIVMLELLAGYDLPKHESDQLMEQYHTTLGGLIAENWHFSEEIQESIRFHHIPASAVQFRQLVEVIHLANLIARDEAPPADNTLELNQSAFGQAAPMPFNDHLSELDREIEAILAPA